MPIAHEDRSIGCLLGTACGDILGAAVEGWSAADIRRRYGQVRDFLDTDRGLGCYTDDTQIRSRWHEIIENGKHGRDEIRELARKLAQLNIDWDSLQE